MNVKWLNNLKEALVDEGVITQEQLRSAEKNAHDGDENLTKILVKLNFMTQEQLADFIANRIHIPYVNLNDYTIDRKVLELIPTKIARRHKFLPLFKVENVLTVAMSDPLGVISTDDISAVARCPVEAVMASEESINAAIDQWYGVGDSRKQLVQQLAAEFKVPEEEKEETRYAEQLTESRLKKEASEGPIIRLVNSYIAEAVLEGASDIHLEPKRDFMAVRFRIDGFLYDRGRIPDELLSSITSRIKIISKLDISKRRIPQDGRISLIMRDRNVDIRVSTFPSLYGENIVLRILGRPRGIPNLSELGLSDEDLDTFNKLSKIPMGIILATGPTGCGKSTTIYSFINTLDKRDKNIVTIEDPIEHEIEGTVQSNVDVKAGFTFANALRAILRQDPDIVYVGEIRDSETAEVAVRAALTGHVVLSTLHTNDAAGAMTRLRDMGINPGLIRYVLQCSFAQRLVRRICPRCKREDQPDDYLLKTLGLSSDTTFYKGDGCDFCGGTGYRGMIGLFEILVTNKHVGALIANEASELEIKEVGRKQGMKTLLEDGLPKAKKGITTLEEVIRVAEE